VFFTTAKKHAIALGKALLKPNQKKTFYLLEVGIKASKSKKIIDKGVPKIEIKDEDIIKSSILNKEIVTIEGLSDSKPFIDKLTPENYKKVNAVLFCKKTIKAEKLTLYDHLPKNKFNILVIESRRKLDKYYLSFKDKEEFITFAKQHNVNSVFNFTDKYISNGYVLCRS
jgi:hypothetical protein